MIKMAERMKLMMVYCMHMILRRLKPLCAFFNLGLKGGFYVSVFKLGKTQLKGIVHLSSPLSIRIKYSLSIFVSWV